MIEGIDLKKVNYIVKYVASTGVLTEKLIKRRNLKTIILLVGNNKEFYFFTKRKI
ncbi:ribose ABC transporter ATP-binding protein [Bacillus wiedmannii]|uniref:ribose ABC transporter ATP-binding protein n=1 Tax=Bacillus wiedmannii TaxID=1890302 RepID=UPI003D22715F